MEEKIKSLQELLKQEKPEKEEVERRTNELLEELQKISQEVYQAPQQNGAEQTPNQPQDENKGEGDEKKERMSPKKAKWLAKKDEGKFFASNFPIHEA